VADLLAAVPEQRPRWLAFDLRGMVEPERVTALPVADAGGAPAESDEWRVEVSGGVLVLHRSASAGAGSGGSGSGSSPSDAADPDSGDSSRDGSALRAVAVLAGAAWRTGTVTTAAGDESAARVLVRLGLPGAG
jgi:hypothetical protein